MNARKQLKNNTHYYVVGTNTDIRPFEEWSFEELKDIHFIIGTFLHEQDPKYGSYLGQMFKDYNNGREL